MFFAANNFLTHFGCIIGTFTDVSTHIPMCREANVLHFLLYVFPNLLQLCEHLTEKQRTWKN